MGNNAVLALATGLSALGVWVIKLITNANDPDRSVKKRILKILSETKKLVNQKNELENKLKNEKDKDERIKIGARVSGINLELSRLRHEFQQFACWK